MTYCITPEPDCFIYPLNHHSKIRGRLTGNRSSYPMRFGLFSLRIEGLMSSETGNKILIVYNSRSGHRRLRFDAYLKALAERDARSETRMIGRGFNMKELLSDAAMFDRIVVAGGDGTISAAAGLLKNTGIPIVPYPGGTANLLARNLNIPVDPNALADVTLNGSPVTIDVGELEYVRYRRRFFRRRFLKKSTQPLTAAEPIRIHFVIMAGCGFFAQLMKAVIPWKNKIGEAAYWLAAFWNLFPRRAQFRLRLDGREIVSSGLGVLVVNLEKIQMDLKVVPDSHPKDGKLEVVIMKMRSLFGLIPVIGAALVERLGFARPSVTDVMETYRASEIEVESDPPLRVQTDGECLHKASSFKVRVFPGAAVFISGLAAAEKTPAIQGKEQPKNADI
jgi:diacylglycerol kinase family enzyme